MVGNEAVVRHDGGLAYVDQAIPPSGTLAEQAAVRPESLVVVPNGLSPTSAVAVGIPGVAAWMSLVDVGHL
ncbi:hypothetical protein SB717_39875, partial [Priestia sp. SIMBA_032]|uniref:hypothetical protein n=1 Tax=Priestia sp. SIMBA_032 TaxID=3085775 RepID=UPI00397AB5AE